MKRFVCETCGSSKLIKQDGLYICEYCRTKYSVEEAKKLFVEVTVSHDEEVKELYVAANRKLATRNWDEAYDTFSQILSLCPNDWEAVFYTEVTKTLKDGSPYFPVNVSSLSKAVKETMIILQDEKDDKELDDYISTINKVIMDLCSVYYEETEKDAKLFESVEVIEARTQIYTACIDLSYYYGDVLLCYFGDRYKDMFVNAWKQGVSFQKKRRIKKCQLGTASDYEAKIQKYEPVRLETDGISGLSKEEKDRKNNDCIFTIIASLAVMTATSLPMSSTLLVAGIAFAFSLLVNRRLTAIVRTIAIFAMIISAAKLTPDSPDSTDGGDPLIVIVLIAIAWNLIHIFLKKKEKKKEPQNENNANH